jgi:uncharacterized protein YqhQ
MSNEQAEGMFMTTEPEILDPKPETRLKIGGMALENGVLFHTYRNWAMAIRDENDEIKLSSGRKNTGSPLARMRKYPLLRGVASLADTATILPRAIAGGGKLPLPTGSPQVVFSVVASMAGTALLKNPKRRMPPFIEEVLISALAVIPSLVALRKTPAIDYHAAEHKSINAYERSADLELDNVRDSRPEHPRCGSNLIGPALALMTIGNTAARRALGRRSNLARFGVGLLSLSGAVELVQWAARNPGNTISNVVTGPGMGMQQMLTTGEPSQEQMAVGLAALEELLRLEQQLPE